MTFSSEGHFNMFCNRITLWLGALVNSAYPIELQVADSQKAPALLQVPDLCVSSFSQLQKVDTQLQNAAHNATTAALETPMSTQGMCSQLLVHEDLMTSGKSVVTKVFEDKEGQKTPEIGDTTILTQKLVPTLENKLQAANECDHGSNAANQTNYALTEMSSKPLGHPSLEVYGAATPFPALNSERKEIQVKLEEPDPSYIFGNNYVAPGFNHAFPHIRYLPETSFNTSLFDSVHNYDLTTDTAVSFPEIKQAPRSQPPTITQEDIAGALEGLTSGSSRTKEKRRKKVSSDPIEDALVSTVKKLVRQERNSVDEMNDEQLCLRIARKLKSLSFASVLRRMEAVVVPSFNDEARQ